jgi:flagellar FliJ protein
MNATQLLRLLDVARMSRDCAASRLARLQQQARQARDHLQTLVGYSDDYADRLQAHAGDQLDPAAQANQRAFLSKLEVALETQRREVGAREQAAAAAQAELAVHQRKLKSLEALMERRVQEELRDTARREQRHTDEAAQRSATPAAAQAGSQSTTDLHRL